MRASWLNLNKVPPERTKENISKGDNQKQSDIDNVRNQPVVDDFKSLRTENVTGPTQVTFLEHTS